MLCVRLGATPRPARRVGLEPVRHIKSAAHLVHPEEGQNLSLSGLSGLSLSLSLCLHVTPLRVCMHISLSLYIYICDIIQV